MDGTTTSISSSRNNDEMGMEKVLSEQQALKRLYGLLHRGPADEKLDETSRALLMKLLDDASHEVRLRQAKTLSTPSDSVIPIRPGLMFPKKMEQATPSVSSFCNNEETGLEKVSADLQALERLYRLLHRGPSYENLDETSRALLIKMLDDASHQAVLRRAKMVSGSSMSPVLEGKPIPSDRRTPDAEPGQGQRPPPSHSHSPGLQTSERPRGLKLQHSTVSSRAGRRVDGHRRRAVEELLLARLASNRSSRTGLPPRRSPSPEPPESGLSLQRPPVAAVTGDRPRGLNLQHSTVSSRASRHVQGHRRAAERPLLARLASNRSSRTALPPRRPPSPEPTQSGVSLHRPPVAAVTGERPRGLNLQRSTVSSRASASRHVQPPSSRTALPPWRSPSPSPEPPSSGLSPLRLPVAAVTASQHGTVTASARCAEQRDAMRRSFRRGEHSPPERSSRRRSASREPSLERPQLLVARDMEAETESSTSKHRVRRLDSGLSLQTASRRGPERAGRAEATTPERSSSSDTTVSTRSRTGPNSVLAERHLRRSAAEEESTPRRRSKNDDDVSSASWSSRRPRRTMNRMDSHSRYNSRRPSSPGSASLSRSASPTASQASIASASYPSSPAYMSRQRSVWPGPVHAPEASGPLRMRRRRERHERRDERLRWFKDKAVTVLHRLHDQGRERHEKRVLQVRKIKDKIAMVLHHRHDHHHHHHMARGQVAPTPWSSRAVSAHHRMSPWQYLGGMFDRTKGKDKKNPSRAVVSGPAKRHGGGGGGNMHALFGATWRHFRGRQGAPAASLTKKGASHSRAQAKKMQWWQGLKGRRGKAEVTAGRRPRRRLL